KLRNTKAPEVRNWRDTPGSYARFSVKLDELLFHEVNECAGLLVINSQAALLRRHVGERKLQLFGGLRDLSDLHGRMCDILRGVVSCARGDILVHCDGPAFSIRRQVNGVRAERNLTAAQGE